MLPSYTTVGLQRIGTGLTHPFLGQNVDFAATAESMTDIDSAVRVVLRSEAHWLPEERAYFAAPYAIGADNDFAAVIDGDTSTKRYVTKMYRKAHPTSATYSGTNVVLKDADNGNVTFATAFGLAFDFTDFAVYMAARTKTHTTDSTRRVLWRWFRLGPDGNLSRVRSKMWMCRSPISSP